jgi:hypothetical protein
MRDRSGQRNEKTWRVRAREGAGYRSGARVPLRNSPRPRAMNGGMRKNTAYGRRGEATTRAAKTRAAVDEERGVEWPDEGELADPLQQAQKVLDHFQRGTCPRRTERVTRPGTLPATGGDIPADCNLANVASSWPPAAKVPSLEGMQRSLSRGARVTRRVLSSSGPRGRENASARVRSWSA